MTFTAKQYKELTKLYPNIRIPFMDKAEYYIELQVRHMDLFPILSKLEDCITKHGDIESYKMTRFDKILKYFKENGILEQFSNAPYDEYQSKYPKQFNNWRDGSVYLSLDVNEANWSIFKHTIGLDLPKWSEFLQQQFDIHPFIAESKSFRQLVLGNLNPSRQQTFQKRYMGKVAEVLAKYNEHIVMLSADEILLEFKEADRQYAIDALPEIRRILTLSDLPLKMKEKTYSTRRVENYGDSVIIKTDLNTGRDELFAVNGNRYFIHYRKLILNEEPQENDLFFEPEPKKLAKWII